MAKYWILSSILTVLVLSGCAGPKIITHATGDQSHMKFLRVQKKFMGSEQEVIRCGVGSDGALTQCKPMALNFQE